MAVYSFYTWILNIVYQLCFWIRTFTWLRDFNLIRLAEIIFSGMLAWLQGFNDFKEYSPQSSQIKATDVDGEQKAIDAVE
jgi:hypothetical protein